MLVGLTGYAQVGKDTAADALVGWERIGFADELRAMTEKLDPYLKPNPGFGNMPRRYSEVMATDGYEWAKKHTDLRRFLVTLGPGMRELNNDIWVRPVALAIVSGPRDIVVTDVRYHNEAKMIKELGGRIIHILRPGYGPANKEEEHSISLLTKVLPTIPVLNEGTIEELHAKVREEARYRG